MRIQQHELPAPHQIFVLTVALTEEFTWGNVEYTGCCWYCCDISTTGADVTGADVTGAAV